MDMEMELRFRGLDNRRLGDLKPSNLEETFGSYDSASVMQLQSPSRHSQMNHYPSSPVRQPPPHGFESSAAMAAAVMNARSSAFAKRSLSFKPAPVASNVSDWGSPNGKLEWGMQRDELNKLRRSASFGIHGNNNNSVSRPARDYSDEPDVSWVNSLVKENAPERVNERVGNTVNGAASRDKFKLPSWAEQMYIDHEQQIVA
jgi:hypothetical protein